MHRYLTWQSHRTVGAKGYWTSSVEKLQCNTNAFFGSETFGSWSKWSNNVGNRQMHDKNRSKFHQNFTKNWSKNERKIKKNQSTKFGPKWIKNNQKLIKMNRKGPKLIILISQYSGVQLPNDSESVFAPYQCAARNF